MSALLKSLISLTVCIATVVCLVASMQAITVVIDPGHGGGDPGNLGAPCTEASMNLKVAGFLHLLIQDLDWRPSNVISSMTHTGVGMGRKERADYAAGLGAQALFSVHHDFPPVNCRGLVYYNDWSLAAPYTSDNIYLADLLAQNLAHRLGRWGVTNIGATLDRTYRDDLTCGLDILMYSDRPTVLGEAFGVACPIAATAICSPNDWGQDPVIYEEAWAYVNTIESFFSVTSIGTSFQAAGVSGGVVLTWNESDPGQVSSYDLYRADTCYGPYSLIGFVDSGDPNYTPDGMSYTFTDNTVLYSREYHYRIVTTNETVDASTTPFGLPAAALPGTPTSLAAVANGTIIELIWSPSSGTVDLYRVFRSRFVPVGNCNGRFEYLGEATTASFQDLSADSNIPMHYGVVAYNSTGASGLSGEATAGVTTDVEEHEIDILEGTLSVLPNGAGFQFSIPTLTRATISIYDVRGRLVATPFSKQVERGSHEVM